MKSRVHYVSPLISVADIERSVEFYKVLGFTCHDMLRDDDGAAFFAAMDCHKGGAAEQTNENYTATIMFGRAEEPIDPKKQGIVLYMYTLDLPGLREKVLAVGGQVTEIEPRFYMKKGEVTVTDPDGYCILVGWEE